MSGIDSGRKFKNRGGMTEKALSTIGVWTYGMDKQMNQMILWIGSQCIISSIGVMCSNFNRSDTADLICLVYLYKGWYRIFGLHWIPAGFNRLIIHSKYESGTYI